MNNKVKAKKGKRIQSKRAPQKQLVKATRRGRSSTSRISSKHQVTIPVEVLRLSKLGIGDAVEFIVTEKGVVEVKKVEPVNAFELFAETVGDALKGFDLEKERAEAWG